MTQIIIRAVPERAEFIDYLKGHLPQARWCMDQTRNAFDTFASALAMAGDSACVHMEEDAILTVGFQEKVDAEIALRPDRVIQFFSMRGADLTEGSRWDRSFLAAVCFYLPAGYSRSLLDYAKTWAGRSQHPTGLDLTVSDFLRARKEPYWITCPSLVQHRVARSVIDSRRSSKRQSKTFRDPMP